MASPKYETRNHKNVRLIQTILVSLIGFPGRQIIEKAKREDRRRIIALNVLL